MSKPSFQFSRSYLDCLNNSLEFVNSRCPLSSGLDQLSIVFLEVTNSGRMLRRNGLNLLPMVFLDFIDPGSSLRRGVGEFAVMLFERRLFCIASNLCSSMNMDFSHRTAPRALTSLRAQLAAAY